MYTIDNIKLMAKILSVKPMSRVVFIIIPNKFSHVHCGTHKGAEVS